MAELNDREEELRIKAMEVDLENAKARAVREQERHEMLGMAVGVLMELKPAVLRSFEVYVDQQEFGDEAAIRAAACALIKKAAIENNGGLKEAAKDLLSVSDKKLGKK